MFTSKYETDEARIAVVMSTLLRLEGADLASLTDAEIVRATIEVGLIAIERDRVGRLATALAREEDARRDVRGSAPFRALRREIRKEYETA